MNSSNERQRYFEPLGLDRNAIIDWCFGNNKKFPLYIEIKDKNVFNTYRKFVRDLEDSALETKQGPGSETVFILRGLAKVLNGDPMGIHAVMDHIPKNKNTRNNLYKLLAFACSCLCNALPIPNEFLESYHMLADPVVSQKIHKWIDDNMDKLNWDMEEGVYTIESK